MSDDLVKRLREDQPVTQDMASTMQCALQDEAADRIEELEAKLAEYKMVAGVIDKQWAESEDEIAELQAKLAEEIEISNQRGNHIEFVLLPQMSDLQFQLEDVKAKLAKAVEVAEKSIKWLRLYGADAHREATTIAELKGEK